MQQIDGLIPKVLTAIELKELELLSWGALDGRFELDELHDIVAQVEARQDVGSIVKVLLERGLLFEVPSGGYRSRMAETVRCLALLRQLFPSRNWWQSPELVLDFRVVHRPRKRPARTVGADKLVDAASGGLRIAARSLLQSVTPSKVAAFQVRSADEVHQSLLSSKSSGVVISAGTGSGKTYGFYLPALAWIADSIAHNPANFVRTLAIYPRNELLKDQLNMAVRLLAHQSLVPEKLSRPIRIGAWFGGVPHSAKYVSGKRKSWEPLGNKAKPTGWKCLYLDCPTCQQPLVWTSTDNSAGIERLICDEAGCGFVLESDQIALTRRSAVKNPPDIIFTTTESLNRQLAYADNHGAFGLAGSQRVRMVLLDEAHTYEGTTGAQSAFLLRRLRHCIGYTRPVTWVGLSATLIEGRQFFADLVNLRTEDVVVVEPHVDELEETGAEYLLALRHNPAFRTGTLSTTIQTAFALERFLDHRSDSASNPFGPAPVDSNGLFGSRTFVFTDKLDITNRLYWDILDAEGKWEEGKLKQNQIPTTLAHIRSGSQSRLMPAARDDREVREPAGQWWWMAERLGHDISGDIPLRVGRTSSQDQGVSDADIIVATASLEVGYDDPNVGAVIQHKAPQDAARFLQRKGRAGRSMEMRPWTVVVLSNWGRDRFAWQAYDQLFDPQLEASRLPLGNRYIQRMQAVYATLDWLGTQVTTGQPDRNTWTDLSGPAAVLHDRTDKAGQRLARQQELERVITEILHGGPARAKLLRHLGQALALGADEVDSLVWTPPRPLLLGVLPTAQRRLESQWDGEVPLSTDRAVKNRLPLTEFVAGNLFDDLLAPEVEVELPSTRKGTEASVEETLPALRVLREFLPGNVTRHFGVHSFSQSHWIPIPVPSADGRSVAEIESYGGVFARTVEVEGEMIYVYRPTRVCLEEPGDQVADSSSTSPVWEVDIEPLGAGDELVAPSKWTPLVTRIDMHLHAQGGGVRICRYVRRALGSLREKGSSPHRVVVNFEAQEQPRQVAALGIEFDADAICIELSVPVATGDPETAERTLRLIESIEEDTELQSVHWAVRRSLAAAALLLVVESAPARDFARSTDVELTHGLRNAVYRLGLSDQRLDDAGRPVVEAGTELAEIYSMVEDAQILARLRAAVDLAKALTRDDAWQAWHRRRVASAFASAFVDAASQLVASFDPSDIAVDIVSDQDGGVKVWISEEGPGGNGQIEALRSVTNESSSIFWNLVRNATAPSDLVQLDEELCALINGADSGIAKSWRVLKASWPQGHASAQLAMEEMRRAVGDAGLPELSRQALGFICTRLAGPGAPEGILSLMAELIGSWIDLEATSGFAVDARTFGVVNDANSSLDEDLEANFTDLQHRSRAIAGLFWARSLDARVSAETSGHVYGFVPLPAVDVLHELLPAPFPSVACDGVAEARIAVEESLQADGQILLVLPDPETARQVVGDLMENPIEAGPLLVHPRVLAMGEEMGGVTVLLAASELEL